MRKVDAATRWSLGLWSAFGLLPAVVSMFPWAEWKADTALAAWVQAIGAVLAIVATGATIVLQHALTVRHKAAEERSARRRRIEGARQIIKGGANVLGKTVAIFIDAGPLGPSQLYLTHAASEMGVIADVLGRVDTLDFDEWPQTEAVATALSAARSAHSILTRHQQTDPQLRALGTVEMARTFKRLQDIMMSREAVLAAALGHPRPPVD